MILNFIIFDFYRRKITRDNDSFKFFNLKENAFARKLTVNFIITTTSFFLIAFIFISLANYSKYEADDKSLKMFNLFSEDVTLCNYDEVTEVNVYLEMESRGRHNSGYATVIELKTEKDTYKLSSSGFQDDYLLIKRFLSCFESEIIKVDNTFSDETEEWKFYGYPENPEIFEEIYKPASFVTNRKP
ncbi:MAG: hypothetical protein IKC01_06590 [Clostridia bacterium]|nr:hypothetical protein [Clostridia bacterium]